MSALTYLGVEQQEQLVIRRGLSSPLQNILHVQKLKVHTTHIHVSMIAILIRRVLTLVKDNIQVIYDRETTTTFYVWIYNESFILLHWLGFVTNWFTAIYWILGCTALLSADVRQARV